MLKEEVLDDGGWRSRVQGRSTLLVCALLATAFLSAPAQGDEKTDEPLLVVQDGRYFYDSKPNDGVCQGDTNDHTQGEALRHWHVGLPFQNGTAEPAGGFGCLGGPQNWTVTVPSDKVATVQGTIDYIWDQNVPGGGFNDVHLHVYNEDGDRVYSTYDEEGYQPVIPRPSVYSPGEFSVVPGQHTISTTLEPGTYNLQEDVFAGEHTAWLTNLKVTVPS